MRYSICLIVPTVGRVTEVYRLFQSLEIQTCKDFQVVLVDQNQDGRLDKFVDQYIDKLNLVHVYDKGYGAAHARNVGFDYCAAEVVLWPDDDSWYPDDLIMNVNKFFSENHEIEAIIGYLFDEHDSPHSRWYSTISKKATLMDAFILGAEPVLGFRQATLKKLDGFDENLGTGARTPWGAGEGTDLCIRALKNKSEIIVLPSLKVFHKKISTKDTFKARLIKEKSYARGMGAVIRKNNLPFWFNLKYLFTYLRAIIWKTVKMEMDSVVLHITRLNGFIEGVIKFRRF